MGLLILKVMSKEANELIENFDIRSGQGENSIVRGMSGGNQQKAIIAREISNQSDFINCRSTYTWIRRRGNLIYSSKTN